MSRSCPRCGENRMASAASASERWVCPRCGAMLRGTRSAAFKAIWIAAAIVAVGGIVLGSFDIQAPCVITIVVLLGFSSWIVRPGRVVFADDPASVHCRSCEHDVREQAHAGVTQCPECGADLPESFRTE